MSSASSKTSTRLTQEYIEEYLERRYHEVESLEFGGDTLCRLSLYPVRNYSGPMMFETWVCPDWIAKAFEGFITKFPEIEVYFYSCRHYEVTVENFVWKMTSDLRVVRAYQIAAKFIDTESENVVGHLMQGIQRAVYVVNDIEEPDEFQAENINHLRYILPYLELLGLLPLQ